MRSRNILPALLLAVLLPAILRTVYPHHSGISAQEGPEPLPFYMPVPEGWRTETIPFPIDFAPGLDYEGIEELRFAPGMFQEGSEDFWTYAFVWWIPEETEIHPERLAADLEAYFSGLAIAVADSRGFDASAGTYDVTIDEDGKDIGEGLMGTAKIFEPFVTGKALTLNIRVNVIPCGEEKAVFFEISPQPAGHPVWSSLQEIRSGFRCDMEE
jgi:hypothetical protein